MKLNMFSKSVVFLNLAFASIFMSAKEIKYKVSDIPIELTKNAKAVIRNSEIKFLVKDINSAQMDVNYAITVLNENGIENSKFMEFYDKFIRINNNIHCTVYDKNGEKVKRIPLSDIADYSAVSGYSIYEDNRVKYIDPEYRTTPFTVEYSFQVKFKGILYYPPWVLYNDYNVAIEKAKFQVIVPKDIKFRYYESNMDTK